MPGADRFTPYSKFQLCSKCLSEVWDTPTIAVSQTRMYALTNFLTGRQGHTESASLASLGISGPLLNAASLSF